ncbi:MAG: hypothetical protein ACE5E9_08915 [Nitrospinaceae bacterium]
MFFEVKVFDADGELKRVITPRKLSKRFWKKENNNYQDYTDYDTGTDDWNSRNSLEKVRYSTRVSMD